MLWFKKKEQLIKQAELEKRVEEEIPLNDAKQDEAITQTKEVAKDFNNVIEENGFTLRIFQATGGKLRGAHK